MTRHLHLSIGPVQGFVAQSRRTRDLWGGSYLLSFLAAHAIAGAKAQGTRLVRPKVGDDDPMLRWIAEPAKAPPPRLGSIPNRLTFEIRDGKDPRSVATAAEHALREAWRRMCDAVWERHVSHAAPLGLETRAIWQRQIARFWEILWVAGTEDEPHLLDWRKRWRTHWLSGEGGTKCAVIPQFQELSGYVRATDSRKQDAFWEAVSKTGVSAFDLQVGERLCAVALVKRLFPSVSRKTLGGYIDVRHWPSTVDVAATPWRDDLLARAPADAESYLDAVMRTSPQVAKHLRDEPSIAERFHRLDANWFHRRFVATSGEAPPSDKLRSLLEKHGGPPIYFALLLADGDSLGTLVESQGSDVVSGALAKFTRAVPGIVREQRGVTVYAGGDDVLALLPLEGALRCAREIERAYRASFGDVRATLSAAVVFTHARDPLNWILAEAHRLLDDVAKEGNGRSSLAAAVYRATTVVQWVTTWERPSPGGLPTDAVDLLLRLKDELASTAGALSGALVQDLRLTFSLLCGGEPLPAGSFARLGEGIDPLALVRSEIEHRLEHRDGALRPGDVERLAAMVRDLLDRAPNGGDPRGEIGVDGLMLASFLAGGGKEEEHEP